MRLPELSITPTYQPQDLWEGILLFIELKIPFAENPFQITEIETLCDLLGSGVWGEAQVRIVAKLRRIKHQSRNPQATAAIETTIKTLNPSTT